MQPLIKLYAANATVLLGNEFPYCGEVRALIIKAPIEYKVRKQKIYTELALLA
jgi:hypothetical protein